MTMTSVESQIFVRIHATLVIASVSHLINNHFVEAKFHNKYNLRKNITL